MYPYKIFLGMSLYEIFILVGIISALAIFRILGDRVKFRAGLQNLVIICGIFAIVGGYLCAIFAQAIYNSLDSGVFEITENTGSTFYGGFIGGAIIFLVIYFTAGHFIFKNKDNHNYHLSNFFKMTDIGAASVAGAHAFGRIGCLMAGCCHGEETTSWIGIWNESLGYKTVPVQLFEAIFLFALCAFLIYRCVKSKTFGLSYYLFFYGVWRFFIEFLRSDDRGASFISFLSPSQLTALVLMLVGIVVYAITEKMYASHLKQNKKI